MSNSKTMSNKTSFRRLIILSWLCYASVQVAGQNTFQCYLDDNHFNTINMVPVDISYQCCADNEEMYSANYDALRNELASCAEDVMSDFESYCNRDFTRCTIDYHSFSCDDTFMQSCSEAGGLRAEADVRFNCDDGFGGRIVMEFLNKVECIAPVCTDEEILEVYKTAAEAMDCDLDMVGNVIVDGRGSGLSFGAGGGEQGGYSPNGGGAQHEGQNSQDNKNTGAIVGGIIGGLLGLAILLGALVFSYMRVTNSVGEETLSHKQAPRPGGVSPVSPYLASLAQKLQGRCQAANSAEQSAQSTHSRIVKTVNLQSYEPDGSKKVVTTNYHEDGTVSEMVEYFSEL